MFRIGLLRVSGGASSSGQVSKITHNREPQSRVTLTGALFLVHKTRKHCCRCKCSTRSRVGNFALIRLMFDVRRECKVRRLGLCKHLYVQIYLILKVLFFESLYISLYEVRIRIKGEVSVGQ